MVALRFTVLFVATLFAGSLFAQAYPTRPIRIVSPYAAGGGNDTLSRIIGDKLGEQLGQRVIVENRPGANTIIGTEVLAKSPPDGYTLILLPNTLATNPSFYPKLPYDALRDFAPIAEVAQSPQMLVVHPSFPPRTVKELVAFSKANPGQTSYGTTGNTVTVNGSANGQCLMATITRDGDKITIEVSSPKTKIEINKK